MATTAHDNSRDQHLGGALAYAKGKIDLLRPTLPGFNANGSPTPLDFPIWQALSAVLMKCFGIWYGWGNTVSLLFYFSSVGAVFDLCRRLTSLRTAWWAVVFLLLQPLTVTVGGQAGGDSTAWALAMWFIYFGYRMRIDGWGWWLPAVVVGMLCATVKAPFFMAAGLTAFFWMLLRQPRSVRAWLQLSSAGIFGVIACVLWNAHCQKVYVEAEFPTIGMGVGNSDINHWYFGTMAYRLNPYNWIRGGWHLLLRILPSTSFILLPLLAFRLKQAAEAGLSLLAAICTTFVFPTLLWEHDHYFFIYAPAVAWLCAISAAEFENEIWKRLRILVVGRTVILLVTFAASLSVTFMAMHFNAMFDTYCTTTSQLIERETKPTDKLVVWGMNWGDPFTRMDRRGLTGGLALDYSDWVNDPHNLLRLEQLGYTKMVFINPSPFIVALTSVTGQSREKIVDLHQHVPAVAKSWPVVFDSPQVLIVQMPTLVTNAENLSVPSGDPRR